MGELTQLGGGVLRMVERFRHEPGPILLILLERLEGQLQGDARVDQALLRSVVQVANDAPPLLVGGGHQAGARGCELRARLGVRDRRLGEPGEAQEPRLGVGR